jgi:hypothetical protein
MKNSCLIFCVKNVNSHHVVIGFDEKCILFQVRQFMMSPIKDPHLELIIVMFIVPLIVNVSRQSIR